MLIKIEKVFEETKRGYLFVENHGVGSCVALVFKEYCFDGKSEVGIWSTNCDGQRGILKLLTRSHN